MDAKQMLELGERTIASGFDCYTGRNKKGQRKFRPLLSVLAKAEKAEADKAEKVRSTSVKWADSQRTEIMEATPERLAVLESYAADAAEGREIAYDVNEDKLYRNQMAFAAAIGLELD